MLLTTKHLNIISALGVCYLIGQMTACQASGTLDPESLQTPSRPAIAAKVTQLMAIDKSELDELFLKEHAMVKGLKASYELMDNNLACIKYMLKFYDNVFAMQERSEILPQE